ncbi:hypothetical protein RD055328_01470 [Companilactobacillus sp. RD055328]|uniref:hypothetical protein n=1 Tax=Companilactobacillus sp. RD055328 TaxID=2916634 RepID=UPI001FC8DA5E|nr:hypothetical protein [Companilactobacillus sp. RD055328]GKQ42224.1 hypothetical protein RD055328_01470 [Companilactobacillus sp. RD055328]
MILKENDILTPTDELIVLYENDEFRELKFDRDYIVDAITTQTVRLCSYEYDTVFSDEYSEMLEVNLDLLILAIHRKQFSVISGYNVTTDEYFCKMADYSQPWEGIL